ncbi:hypothetical protein I3760_03G012200 [Carya illinoinensis]|nr:hypothetical protein I3760_03G012200 [Carya illinoinensis]
MASTSSIETAYSSHHCKYNVFLSFHGKDTCWGFTSHLYDALNQEGIMAFRDDEKLKRGEFINSGLLKAIEESKYESTVFKNIIERIHRERNIQVESDPYDLVGVDSQVMDMEDLLDIGLDDVRFIGISGMSGIGKMTLAQITYNRFSYQFEASSFILCLKEETERHGLREIINTWDDGRVINEMKSRLRKRRVFIILDDVNENKQLEALAGRYSWFGRGSRVVVTSREKQVLNSHGVCNIYLVRQLKHDEALQLFSWKAFKKPHPEENFLGLSKDFVNYANGLPLTLKILGSFLFDKKIGIWKSFNALKPAERNLFLDVACFFRGWDKDRINIDVLVDKSLMSFSGNNLWMHDLLQEIGPEIVCDESREEPGQRSRLWAWKDVLHVLNNNTVTSITFENIQIKHAHVKDDNQSSLIFSKFNHLIKACTCKR